MIVLLCQCSHTCTISAAVELDTSALVFSSVFADSVLGLTAAAGRGANGLNPIEFNLAAATFESLVLADSVTADSSDFANTVDVGVVDAGVPCLIPAALPTAFPPGSL